MLSHPKLTGCIVICFMVLVGFSMARSIQSGNSLGIVLALISLAAGIYFVYLLKKANEQQEESY